MRILLCMGVCEDVGLHLQAQASLYIFSSSHLDLSDKKQETGYFCEHLVSNLLASQLSADPALSYEWENAYEESLQPYDFVVRLATPQSHLPVHLRAMLVDLHRFTATGNLLSAALLLLRHSSCGHQGLPCSSGPALAAAWVAVPMLT